jgi:hypothetical protein
MNDDVSATLLFLQGSYGNDTNIYAESDVDVVMRTDSIYYSDTSALNPRLVFGLSSSQLLSVRVHRQSPGAARVRTGSCVPE